MCLVYSTTITYQLYITTLSLNTFTVEKFGNSHNIHVAALFIQKWTSTIVNLIKYDYLFIF